MADISRIKLPNEDIYNIKDAWVREQIIKLLGTKSADIRDDEQNSNKLEEE